MCRCATLAEEPHTHTHHVAAYHICIARTTRTEYVLSMHIVHRYFGSVVDAGVDNARAAPRARAPPAARGFCPCSVFCPGARPQSAWGPVHGGPGRAHCQNACCAPVSLYRHKFSNDVSLSGPAVLIGPTTDRSSPPVDARGSRRRLRIESLAICFLGDHKADDTCRSSGAR